MKGLHVDNKVNDNNKQWGRILFVDNDLSKVVSNRLFTL